MPKQVKVRAEYDKSTGSFLLTTNFDRYVASQFDKVELIVKPVKRARRSIDQNSLLWGFIYPQIMTWDAQGQQEFSTVDELHIFIKNKILGYTFEVRSAYGEDFYVMKPPPDEDEIQVDAPSTARLSKIRFSKMINKIVAHFGTKGCEIQLPEEDEY